jgi:hypothetical protein
MMLLGLETADYPTNITLVRQAIVHAINYTDTFTVITSNVQGYVYNPSVVGFYFATMY